MTRPLSCLLIAFAALGLGPVAAQPSSDTSVPEDRYYVELIVFERDDAREKLYRWPGEPATRSALDLWRRLHRLGDPLRSPVGDGSSNSVGEPRGDSLENTLGDSLKDPLGDPLSSRRDPATPTPLLPASDLFQAQDAGRLIMVREWRSLSAEPWLTPLAHRGWHQPAIPFGDPQPIRIWGGATVGRTATDATGLLLSGRTEPIFQVDGTAALERGRFLHLRMDIAVHRPGRPNSTHYSDLNTLEQPGDFMTYRIRERRQVTLNAVNYFDHAFLGVIALVKTWPLDNAGDSTNNP
ncbi:MAG: CsiV family protein [Pseudomonadota bacterium]